MWAWVDFQGSGITVSYSVVRILLKGVGFSVAEHVSYFLLLPTTLHGKNPAQISNQAYISGSLSQFNDYMKYKLNMSLYKKG